MEQPQQPRYGPVNIQPHPHRPHPSERSSDSLVQRLYQVTSQGSHHIDAQTQYESRPATSATLDDNFVDNTADDSFAREQTIGHVTRTSTPQLGTASNKASVKEGEKKPRKGTSTTAANELELKRLLNESDGKSLESIARDVRNAERTQNAERTKQIFAMRWLGEFCLTSTSTDSVPRSKVYSMYAGRCGSDHVDVLNPASFGKLVRVVFPGIATRRLGVRGASRYHYTNLTLLKDPKAKIPTHDANMGDRSASLDQTEMDYQPSSHMSADTAAFPNHDMPFEFTSSALPTTAPSEGRLFADPSLAGFRQDGEEPHMYTQSLKFSHAAAATASDGTINLPSLYNYVDPSTDAELADCLTALYRTHCMSTIDSVRFVKQKQFFRLLGAFNGNMTVPVARLFSQPSTAAWIRTCDWLMYQQIVHFVSQLADQVLPAQVFAMLCDVADRLTQQIRHHFSQYPYIILQAKLEPATVFASLLKRLLRVNETAHAAANLLIQDPIRNVMWQDFVRCVKPKRIIESELPNCGYEETYNILVNEVRSLLEPLEPTDWLEVDTEYQSSALHGPYSNGILPTADNILERWNTFLKSLPNRFSHAQTRVLIHSVNAVSSAVLRDVTVVNAPSFSSWWITKVWIDEMMLWLAEMGGFLDPKHVTIPTSPQQSTDRLENMLSQDGSASPEHNSNMVNGAGNENDNHISNGNPLGLDFQSMPHFEPTQGNRNHSPGAYGPTQATYQSSHAHDASYHKQAPLDFNIHNGASHDDSGVGMASLFANSLRQGQMDHELMSQLHEQNHDIEAEDVAGMFTGVETTTLDTGPVEPAWWNIDPALMQDHLAMAFLPWSHGTEVTAVTAAAVMEPVLPDTPLSAVDPNLQDAYSAWTALSQEHETGAVAQPALPVTDSGLCELDIVLLELGYMPAQWLREINEEVQPPAVSSQMNVTGLSMEEFGALLSEWSASCEVPAPTTDVTNVNGGATGSSNLESYQQSDSVSGDLGRFSGISDHDAAAGNGEWTNCDNSPHAAQESGLEARCEGKQRAQDQTLHPTDFCVELPKDDEPAAFFTSNSGLEIGDWAEKHLVEDLGDHQNGLQAAPQHEPDRLSMNDDDGISSTNEDHGKESSDRASPESECIPTAGVKRMRAEFEEDAGNFTIRKKRMIDEDYDHCEDSRCEASSSRQARTIDENGDNCEDSIMSEDSDDLENSEELENSDESESSDNSENSEGSENDENCEDSELQSPVRRRPVFICTPVAGKKRMRAQSEDEEDSVLPSIEHPTKKCRTLTPAQFRPLPKKSALKGHFVRRQTRSQTRAQPEARARSVAFGADQVHRVDRWIREAWPRTPRAASTAVESSGAWEEGYDPQNWRDAYAEVFGPTQEDDGEVEYDDGEVEDDGDEEL